MKKSLELSHSGLKLLITKNINGKQEVLFSKRKTIAYVDYFDITMQSKIAFEINNLINESFDFLDIYYDTIDISIPQDYINTKYKKVTNIRINSSKNITKEELNFTKKDLMKTNNPQLKSIFFKPSKILLDGMQVKTNEIFFTKCKKIVLEGYVYYADLNLLSCIDKIFYNINIDFGNIYPTGLNFGEFIENVEKDMVTIDMGYKNVSLSKYINNNLYDIKLFKMGAKNIINDIKIKFDINHKEAKNYLERFGEIPPERIKDNRIILSRYDDKKQSYQEYTMKDLSEIITIHINNIFDIIVPILKNEKNTRFVITGGLADLKGLLEYVMTRYKDISFDIIISNTIGAKNTSFINLFSLNKIIIEDPKLVNTNETKINDKIRISINLDKIMKKFKRKDIRR